MNKEIELLSPVGDFECLIAAIQNGANAVYFGTDKFNARASSTNFPKEELKKAIEYAKLRNVKTHLTLNILIKNEEFNEAVNIVKYAYECGIDAIIIQDLGLAKYVIENFPDLEVHASTQMTIYDIDGVNKLKELGFKRVVLARELTIKEIKNICTNTNIDIEVFVHGALCISYSGQCLMSSIIGQRSGNRGKCAGTCRLPYELINKEKKQTVEKGYLLSSKDICTLDIIPDLIESGIKSFKIEGRMKTPEYVGIVTSVYRKYIDLAISEKPYVVDETDRQKLLQVFNRGGFSTGYLKGKLGKDMMYIKRPNHMGVRIGQVIAYNRNKGHIKLKLENEIELGDSIKVNDDSCKTSELMKNNSNIKTGKIGEIVVLGRLKSNIKLGDIVYKTVSMKLLDNEKQVVREENRKRKVTCNLTIQIGNNFELELEDEKTKIKTLFKGNIVNEAEKTAISEDRIKEQICKTGGTVFEINQINMKLSDKAYISIKELNEVRRSALVELEQNILKGFERESKLTEQKEERVLEKKEEKTNVSLLLNFINTNYNYSLLDNVDKVYIPITEFFEKEKLEKIKELSNIINTYIFFPAIIKEEFKTITIKKLEEITKWNIKGFVISNLSQLEIIEKYNLEIIANYNINAFNNHTMNELQKLRISTGTISPELNIQEIQNIKVNINKEMVVYGRTLLMTSEYCPIGTLKNCDGKCVKGKYVLKDRMNFEFPVYTNRINCNSMIYNSKITSINWEELQIDSIRIDVLEENIEEINNIIKTHKQNNRIEGQNYTNGNLKKEV